MLVTAFNPFPCFFHFISFFFVTETERETLLTRLILLQITWELTLVTAGWTYNFLSEFESSGILPVSSRRWSFDLHVEGQCSSEDSCGMCDLSMEFLGCISFHEFSSEPKKKSSCTLSCVPYVCISWSSHHCHRLRSFNNGVIKRGFW